VDNIGEPTGKVKTKETKASEKARKRGKP